MLSLPPSFTEPEGPPEKASETQLGQDRLQHISRQYGVTQLFMWDDCRDVCGVVIAVVSRTLIFFHMWSASSTRTECYSADARNTYLLHTTEKKSSVRIPECLCASFDETPAAGVKVSAISEPK